MNIDLIREKLPELDYETGLAYCADDPEFFEEMMGEYANDKYNQINEFYNAKDWKNYEILVHALKSSSRTVGFTSFGDVCEKMQFAAADANEDYILSNHAALMAEYKKYLDVIHEAE